MKPWKPIRTFADLEELLNTPGEVERRKAEGMLAFRNYSASVPLCAQCGRVEEAHEGETKECPPPASGIRLA